MTRPMRRPAIAVLTSLALLAAPSSALASSDALFKDCADNSRIDGTYTQKQFATALKNIPTDVDEYTDCRDVIRRAQLGAAGGTNGGSGTGGAGGGAGAPAGTPPSGGGTAADIIAAASPSEQQAVRAAIAQDGAAPVQVGGRTLSADRAGLSPAGTGNVLPTPLVVALVLLALGLIAGAAQTLRTRVLAGRTPAT